MVFDVFKFKYVITVNFHLAAYLGWNIFRMNLNHVCYYQIIRNKLGWCICGLVFVMGISHHSGNIG